MHVRTFLSAAALAVAALLPSALPASASCMFDDRPVEAKVQEATFVAVGTVVATRHGGTTAEVQLDEVWKGDASLRRIVVQGGSGQDGMATSVDRSFVEGTRYLLFPQPDGNIFLDNACSATQEWSDDLAAARPADATTIDASEAGAEADGGDPPVGVVVAIAAGGLAVAGAAGAAAMAASRRREDA